MAPDDNDDVMEEEEEEEIDEEQVEDYCEMLDKLGNFPEKVAINSLSMAAEDFDSSPKSATVIFNCIRSRLVDCTTKGISSPDRKLPLVYVLDSLLKNVKGVYIDIILGDAADWLTAVYNIFDKAKKEDEKARLKKVWNSWKQFGVIKDEERWRQIGQCFSTAESSGGDAADANSSGIARNADGSLKLPSKLRAQMQILLDEVQADGVDELEKVSLERLADINPSLLQQIKEGAEMELQDSQQTQSLGQQQSSSIGGATTSNNMPAAPPATSMSEWSKLKLNHLEKSHDLVASLNRHVRSATQQTTVVKSEMDNTVHLYASVSASAQLLTDMLHQWKVQQENGTWFGIGEDSSASRRKRRYSLVKKEKFTTDGIKEHNDAVIARLYEVGLPFVCSADGRRFATQIELSNHLDALFRKNKLEKTMEKTEERGWYVEEKGWEVGVTVDITMTNAEDEAEVDPAMEDADDDIASSSNTVIADETRDRCILCGINFAMFFDQEDGEWKYRNCVEKDLEVNDGPTMDEDEAEAKLVHYSCWKGLGSPAFLTSDQVLHAN